MDTARDDLTSGLDLGERDELGRGHAADGTGGSRPGVGGLDDLTSRTCVIAQTLQYFAYMVIELTSSRDEDYQKSAVIGRALADPKRLCVLESLADGEVSVSDLSSRVGCQVPNMSQHLAVLRSAGLVTTRRDGNTVYYRLADPRVLEAFRLIQSIAR
jgi:ArsR family transcriptional regulator